MKIDVLGCGHTIPDSSYPCSSAGYLLWEAEVESQSEKARQAVADYLKAARAGCGREWSLAFFGDDYPPSESEAEVIHDIYAVAFHEKGRSVLVCPECDRVYIQRQFFSDEWYQYEKEVLSKIKVA